MSKIIKINDRVTEILRGAKVEGNVAFLQSGQLDRVTYSAVDKALKALGGKWNRKVGGHVFDHDPREALGQALDSGGVVDVKKTFGQFFTPTDVAERMVDELYLKPGLKLLEPSCGDGRLIRAIAKAGLLDQIELYAYEIDIKLADMVRAEFGSSSTRQISRRDFLEASPRPHFDRVIMNPTFNDGDDMKHIGHATRFLKPGGCLISVCAGGPRQREFFDVWARNNPNSWWEDLPAGTFKTEGTSVSTALMFLDYPSIRATYEAPRPMPNKVPPPPLPMLDLIERSKAR